MTLMQRQRLNTLMSEIEYRQRLARRFLLAIAITGILSLLMAAVTSCAHRESEFPKLTDPEKEAFAIFKHDNHDLNR